MKLTFLYSIFFLSISFSSYSQLRNCSFELYNGLPNSLGQFHLAKYWGNCNSVSATPDYYHLNGINGGDLPSTPAAIISPAVGSAIMGLTLYNHDLANKREYISTKLTAPMEIGVEYKISFKLANGVIPVSSNAGYAIDKIGFLFSKTELFQNGTDPITETPQFKIDSVFYSREWQTIKFSITPNDNFDHLSIGVFYNDDELVVEQKESTAKIAYYFIDNITIRNSIDLGIDRSDPTPTKPDPEVIPLTNNIAPPYYIPNSFTPNGDGENDFFVPIINTQEDFTFEVYSRWGELIFKTSTKNIGWDGKYKGKPMPQEVYVWTLRYKSFEGEKLVDKQFQGQINLMR